MAQASVDGTLFRLVSDCHSAVFPRDDLQACGLGRGVRVDGDTRLGRAVGAPGTDVATGLPTPGRRQMSTCDLVAIRMAAAI